MAWVDKMPLKKVFFLLSIQPHTFRICWIHNNAFIQCPESAEEAIHDLFTLVQIQTNCFSHLCSPFL